jgi:hypothetical protein
MKKKLHLILSLGIVGILLFACSDTGMQSPTSSSSVGDTGSYNQITNEPTSHSPSDAPDEHSDGSCIIVAPDQAGIKWKTKCLTVSVYVPAGNADYVDLWLNEVNSGEKLKRCAVNEWCEYTFDKAGTYTIRLAIEKRKPGGGIGAVWQCDRIKKSITVKDCNPPECPADAYYKINVSKLARPDTYQVDHCPEVERWNYTIDTNCPLTKLTALPSECSNGVCTFPVTPQGGTYTIAGEGWRKNPNIKCSEDSVQMVVEPCTPCIACEDISFNPRKVDGHYIHVPKPPEGTYYTVGDSAFQHTEEGTYGPYANRCDSSRTVQVKLFDTHCSRTVKCQQRNFTFRGDPCYQCDVTALNPGCYPGNIDNKQHLFNRFGICMQRTHRTGAQNRACTTSRWNAGVVIVKGGPGFRLYTNVRVGDRLCTYCPGGITGLSEAECFKPNISHISYFRCNANAQCREQ